MKGTKTEQFRILSPYINFMSSFNLFHHLNSFCHLVKYNQMFQRRGLLEGEALFCLINLVHIKTQKIIKIILKLAKEYYNNSVSQNIINLEVLKTILKIIWNYLG